MMKSECGRFEYHPFSGITDTLHPLRFNLKGNIIWQMNPHQETRISDTTKKLLADFAASILPHVDRLDAEARAQSEKENNEWHFRKGLNEGYLD